MQWALEEEAFRRESTRHKTCPTTNRFTQSKQLLWLFACWHWNEHRSFDCSPIAREARTESSQSQWCGSHCFRFHPSKSILPFPQYSQVQNRRSMPFHYHQRRYWKASNRDEQSHCYTWQANEKIDAWTCFRPFRSYSLMPTKKNTLNRIDQIRLRSWYNYDSFHIQIRETFPLWIKSSNVPFL